MIIYFQTKNDTSDLGTLKSTLETYKGLNLDGNFEGVVEYMYPESYIGLISKDELLIRARRNLSKLKIIDLTMQPRLPIKSYAKGVYTIVTYTQKTTVYFPPLDIKNKDEKSIRQAKIGRNMMLALAKSDLKSGDTMDVDRETNSIYMTKSGTMIFINEKETGWKFINLSSIPKKLLKKILHTEIINEEQELIAQTKDSMMLDLFRRK